MRPQDEIALALPRQDVRGRRFLLRRLRNLPLAMDSMEILSLARRIYTHEGSLAAWLTEEVLYERREKDRLHRSVGEEAGEAGAWTNLMGAGAGGAAAAPAPVENASVAAGKELSDLLPDLETGAERGKDALTYSMRALGHIHSKEALDLTIRLAQKHQAVVPAMGVFATHGGDAAADKAVQLCRIVETHPAFPSLIEGFAYLPTATTFGYLKTLIGKGGEITAGVAAALEGFAEFDNLPLIDAAARGGDPWILINLVETLGRIGTPDHLARIEAVFDQNPHPLIRIACLQALSATTGDKVFTLARKGLASDNEQVRAAAIEALISAQVPYAQFRDQVVSQLGAAHPKLALNAALACVAVDPERAVAHTTAKLRSGKPAELLQAIQCLAYVEANSSVQGLSKIIHDFPPGAMRVQAVKSLGRLASRLPDAVETLASVLRMDDPKARESAAWFLAGVHPAGRERAAHTLAAHCRTEDSTPASLATIEAIGLLGRAGSVAIPDLHYLLLVGPLQAEAAARALATSFPRSREAEDLPNHGDPAVAGYGGLLSWYREAVGTDLMRAALGTADSFVYRAGCEVLRLAALAATATGETTRLTGLARALGSTPLDPTEVSGLGRLDQSISIPRRKIGLGVVPRTDTRTAQFAPSSLDIVAPAGPPEETSQVLEAVVRDASYYPTDQSSEGLDMDEEPENEDDAPTAEVAPVRREEPPAAPPPAPTPAPATPAKAPAGGKPGPGAAAAPPGGMSRMANVAYWLGVAVLCVLALYAGQALKRMVG